MGQAIAWSIGGAQQAGERQIFAKANGSALVEVIYLCPG